MRDQAADPVYPNLGMSIASIDTLSSLLIVGSNLRREVAGLAHRVRKAARKGMKVAMLNPSRFDYKFPLASYLQSAPAKQIADLAAILPWPRRAQAKLCLTRRCFTREAQVGDSHRAVAAALHAGEQRAIWLGALAIRHPSFADLRALASALAEITGASFGVLAEGGNAAGAISPVRFRIARRRKAGAKAGLSAAEMLQQSLKPICCWVASSRGLTHWIRKHAGLGEGGARRRDDAVRD